MKPTTIYFLCTAAADPRPAQRADETDDEVSLVYFSTFEPIDLTPDSIMQRAGVPMLYDSASNQRLPCLYICPVANVLGRAPFIPCFIGGNRSGSWKCLRRHAAGPGYGSRLYEVNIWMWRYGRGHPQMVSIAEAERIRRERISESRIRAGETRKRRSKAAAAAVGAAEGGGGVQ